MIDFELDFAQPGAEGGLAWGCANVDTPAFGVVGRGGCRAVGGGEWPGFGADDERARNACVLVRMFSA